MENGVGVVMDDFLAGVIGNLILALIAGALWG
jgi:phosphatidylglycerophosphatase A